MASFVPGAIAQEKIQKMAAPSTANPVEFIGYVSVPKDCLFILYDTAAKKNSPWIEVGQTWQDCTLVSFDPKTKELTLRKEKTDFVVSLRSSKVNGMVVLPSLAKGSYVLVDGTVVYSPDAQLKLGRGVLISSPTGVMVSDPQQKEVAGDLTIESSHYSVQATDAVVNVNQGHATAKSIHVTAKTSATGSQTPEPTHP